MRRASMGFLILCLIVLMPVVSAAALDAEYTGEWVGSAIDVGDGVKLTEYEGVNVSDLMKIEFKEDGTLTVTSFGQLISGTWEADAEGVSAVIDSQQTAFRMENGQLVNNSDGVRIYLERTPAKPRTGGFLGSMLANKYVGDWACAAVDEGDGILQTQYQGVDAAEWMSLKINRDKSVVMTSMGEEYAGTWSEADGGISITVNGETAEMVLQNGRLTGSEGGTTVYFDRADQTAPEPTPVPPTSDFAGNWTAVRYEAGEYAYNANLLFPEGCTLTLNEDGTGSAKITAEYTEKLTWSEQDGLVTISGGSVLSDARWDANSRELRLKYGNGDVFVVFVKGEATAVSQTEEFGLIETQTSAKPSLKPDTTQGDSIVPAATPEMEDTAESVPAESAGGQAFTSPLFSASFPADWISNEYNLSADENYCSVKYEKKDPEGNSLCAVAIYASSESVDSYRSRIKRLAEYAEAGGGALEESTVGGVKFLGAQYENWGWKYREYAARVPESSVTLNITVEQPENAGEALQPILDSIAFTLPSLDPPNVDPPMPEDGTPYQPTPKAVSAGKYNLEADWIVPNQSILLDSIFGNQIAVANNKLYVLSGKELRVFTVKNNKLIPEKAFFDGGVMKLSDSFESLSAGKDGTLYVSQGVFNTLAFKDGKLLKDNALSGDVVMHPGGKWGISFWANADTKKVTDSKGVLTEEPWVLTGLSDPAQRKGRFSMINCVYLSEKRVYVAGNDAESGDAQRVAVFDLDGKELFSIGALDWTQEDAFGSITGIVETKNGILVQDGNNRSYKLFTKDGAFIGAVDGDELLGTKYPWLSSMIPNDGGVYVAAAQRRDDQSCDELLLFKITGF